MFVIEIIPLVRGVQIESLTYFSGVSYERGTVVAIPVRGKTVSGVVIDQKPVSSTKTALKAATFSLRKLPPQANPVTLSQHLLSLVEILYRELPAKRGAILFSLLPPDIRNGNVPYPHHSSVLGNEDPTPQILAAPKNERFISYQTIIRGAFAHRGSVLLVVPTASAVSEIYDALEHGIKDRIIRFSPDQTKKARLAAYENFHDMSKATLTITTPAFAYLDRSDCTTIIIEEIGSSHYVERVRPYLDHRVAITRLATLAKRSLIFGDIAARTEDEYFRRDERYQTYGEEQKRLTLPATLTIISQADKPKDDVPFSLFSPELKKHIETTIDGRHNVFLFAARRGLSPVVACVDCGYIFRCPDSGTPYSLLRTRDEKRGEERWFISGTSGKRIRAADVCPQCGSWRLRERGIGIQHIEDELIKLFPQTPRVVFDATTANTHRKALALKKIMSEHKGAIFLGTSMIMPYLPDNIYLSGIVSLDAVRAIPTWRADESLFRLLLTLREKSNQEVMVQTRVAPDDLLIYASRGATERFHDDELALRQMLNYPPFATFVFLTWQGSLDHNAATETELKTLLKAHENNLQFYTSPHSQPKEPIRHCLIRIPNHRVTTTPLLMAQPPSGFSTLIDQLRHLPPHITIMINPDRIV